MTTSEQPDARMLDPVYRVIRFQQTGARLGLDGAFVDSDKLVIVDSFAPHIFRGPVGLRLWLALFTEHVSGMDRLEAELDAPQEFARTDDSAYFSQPIRWRYQTAAGQSDEVGGLGVVLKSKGETWQILALTWAVTSSQLTK